MSKEKIYVSENDQGAIIWFVKKSDRWFGNQYNRYDEYVTSVDDMLAVSKLNGIKYERVDIGNDPFVIVGTEPIYDFNYDRIIFQSDHKYSPLDDFKKSKYIVSIVTDPLDECCTEPNRVYIQVPIATAVRFIDAAILDPYGHIYNILFDLHTGDLLERSDVLKED